MISPKEAIARHRVLLSNILFLVALQGANYVIPLITLPYLVITLGVEKFGVLALAQAVIAYFTILVEYGFNLSATRSVATNVHDREYLSLLFASVITIKLGLLAFAALVLTIIVGSFDRLAAESAVYYLTFAALFGSVVFPVWYFQGVEDMKYITYINIFSRLASTLAIFIFVREPQDYILVPMLNSLGSIVGGSIAFGIALRRVGLCMPPMSMIKSTMVESTSLFVSNASITLFTASNTLILGLFSTNAVVGVYSAIERLMMAVKGLYAPLYQALYPWLSRKDFDNIVLIVRRLAAYVFIPGLVITVICFVFARYILNVVYGSSGISQHAYVFQIFSFVFVLSALSMLFNYLFLNAVRAYRVRMLVLLASGVFNVVFSFILTQEYGMAGTALAAASTEAVLLLLGYLAFRSSVSRRREV